MRVAGGEELLVNSRDKMEGELCLNAERLSSDLEERVTEIFDLWRDPIYRYLWGVTGNSAEAEDLSQEVFLRLYSCLQKGQQVDNARAWVFRVAHNLAVDQQRKSQPVDSLDSLGWELASEARQDPAPDPEQEILEREKQTRIHLALRRLSPQERYCLDLRAEGLRYREIAEILGIRTPSVVTFLARGMKKIMRATHD